MSNKNVSLQIGPGFGGLLCLLFVALKLTHVIAWSWLWVLSPLWLGFAIGLAIVIAGLFITVLVSIFGR